ncbi:MAG: peptidase, partial [Gemmatimonadota bacterium]
IKNGVTVHRATQAFDVNGVSYPRNSYVVLTAQAFRPHVMDMFEPQDHPNDFDYEGGPPNAPYDNAGYTLAYQMDIEFDRILEGFDGPFEKIDGFALTPPGHVTSSQDAAGFLLSHKPNDAAIAVNRLLRDGTDVYWLSDETTVGGTTYPVGTIYIPTQGSVQSQIEGIATELGLSFDGVGSAPSGDAFKLRPVRIGLWDQYGGSMPSGWTRWLMEQFEFPFEVVYPQTLDAGNLKSEFDVLVFVTGAIPAADRGGDPFERYFGGTPDPESIPPEFRSWLGRVTVSETVPKLLQFMEQGGAIIAIGSSTTIAGHAGLPIDNHLVDENGRPLPWDKYYVPGSVLRVRVDNTMPLAFGFDEQLDVFFNNSSVFNLLPSAYSEGVRPVAWFDSTTPLRSGWAWGQHHLNGGVAVAEAKVGTGSLYLFGPEILNRGQPHGTFKFFFNGIFLAGVEEVRLDLTN